jgi:subtilisin family serine protease
MSPLRTRLAALTCTAAVVLASGPVTGSAHAEATVPSRVGLDRLLATDTGSARGIATFAAVPSETEVDDLRALGLAVQPMQELPLALVQGPVSALTEAVSSGVADDVYPDEKLRYDDTSSSNEVSSSLGAAERLRAQGFTGKGVTVGIVDSGCDGTHPDLADHIKHNVTLVSGEYVNQEPNEGNTLVLPVDQGPFRQRMELIEREKEEREAIVQQMLRDLKLKLEQKEAQVTAGNGEINPEEAEKLKKGQAEYNNAKNAADEWRKEQAKIDAELRQADSEYTNASEKGKQGLRQKLERLEERSKRLWEKHADRIIATVAAGAAVLGVLIAIAALA